MRTLTSMIAAAAVLASSGLCRADSSTLAGERVEKSAGPVDGVVRYATRGPGAQDIQPERRVVPPVASMVPTWGQATDHGHTPTNDELAKGATPAIVELPPVARPLEFAEEGVRTSHHGAGQK